MLPDDVREECLLSATLFPFTYYWSFLEFFTPKSPSIIYSWKFSKPFPHFCTEVMVKWT